MTKLWFKAKRYGWGWTPSSWEGWLTLIIWGIAVVLVFRPFSSESHTISSALFILALILTIIMLVICWIKGEKPRWRWG